MADVPRHTLGARDDQLPSQLTGRSTKPSPSAYLGFVNNSLLISGARAPDQVAAARTVSVVRATLTGFAVLAALQVASPATAQEILTSADLDGIGSASTIPTVQAAARTSDIRIDGRVDEAAWQRARPSRDFVQGEPVEGAAPEERTEVRVLYDTEAIFVGVALYDRDPQGIGDQLVRRDEQGQYDYFELSLDPNNDRRTGYRFRVSAAGVQRDVYLYDDTDEDEAWDAVWESAVHRDSSGWTAELRIPLSQVRYDAADSLQSWGVNFSRRRVRSNERTYLALESRVSHGKVSVFGRLEGLRLPQGSRRLELRPYALSSAHTAPAVAGDPFFDGSKLATQAGLDVRYGLGAAYTLDLTVNPDFGQVEVDPAVINLTAFETFFPEKRPFFVEDAQIFDFSLSGRTNRLFYSRRIGREPRGSAPDGADFSEIPGQTTILGAAKLTGRTPSGLSIGALAAVTGQERGSAFDSTSGVFDEFTVEPRSEFGVVRVQQDFRGGASQIGAIVAGMHRNLPADGSFDFLTSNVMTAGVDFEHNWGGARSRNWALWGYLGGTHVRGSPEALLRIQQASNHYFQRPDATRFSVDSAATSLTGVDWRLQFERRSAEHWTGALWLGEVTSGFEVNDIGFSTQGERIDLGGRLSYREIRPGRLFRSYRLNAFTFHNFRHEALDDAFSWQSWKRAHKRGAFSASADVEFLNYWGLDVSGWYSPQSQSDAATRGGPLMLDPASTRLTVRGNTDRRHSVTLQPSFTYEWRHQGAYNWSTGLDVVLRPAPSLELRIEPSYSKEVDPAQYVSQTDDVGFGPTYGRRYIFSDLARRSFSVETRLNMTFTPNLTLQLFAQPLLSSGDYLTYKQLERSESFDFDVFEEGTATLLSDDVSCQGGRTCVSGDTRYVDFDGDGSSDFSFSDRDFNVQSLRLNAVLRWQYRPGSTVFLVWQQSRRNREDAGTFDLGRDFGELWNTAAENVFILKFTYWFGL